MLEQKILAERGKLMIQSHILESKIKTYPEGELLCVRNGKYVKWFKSNASTPLYISKSNHQIAKALAVKKYYSLQLKEILYEITLLNHYLEEIQKCKMKSCTLLDETSPYKELLTSHFQTFPEELLQWQTASYETNTNHAAHLIHKTLSGHNVRSKSEVIIANALFSNGIPYRYECGLYLGDTQFFPDFTIRHPKTLTTFYWEHFGMMSNHSYCENAFNKLKIYSNNDILPSIQLITTYETQMHPIDSEKVQQLIQEYFL